MFEDYEVLPDVNSDTYAMLKCAFPKGISQQEYLPLLGLLQQYVSQRTVARVVAYLRDLKDFDGYVQVLHDTYTAAATFSNPKLDEVEAIEVKLEPCGFETWKRLRESELGNE